MLYRHKKLNGIGKRGGKNLNISFWVLMMGSLLYNHSNTSCKDHHLFFLFPRNALNRTNTAAVKYLERQCFYFNSVSEVHIFYRFRTNDTRLHVCSSHTSTTRRTLTSTWQQTCTNKAGAATECTDQPLAWTQRASQSQWAILLSRPGEQRTGGRQRRGKRWRRSQGE